MDSGGHFLFLKGKIGDRTVTFANLYAPNAQQDVFLKRRLEQLQRFTEGHLILGGDLNVPLIPTEDTSSGKSSLTRDIRKRISATLHSMQLTDAWRLLHSGERDYTFLSKLHQTYSRIDYFLLSHRQLDAIQDVAIGSIRWSDHARSP